jgi:hypothetical protein
LSGQKLGRIDMKMIAAAVMSLTLGASALAQTGTTGTAPASSAPGNADGNPAHMVIARAGSQASTKGPAQNFTGSVRVDPLFGARAPSSVSGAAVTFEPGARSAWHTHPMGQVLIVTAGAGRIQQWGGVVPSRRRHLDAAWRQALARRRANDRSHTHRHSRKRQWQECRMDGESQR